MRDLLKILVLPPMVLFIGMAAGYVLSRRGHRAGVPLMAGAFGLLVILSLPAATFPLMGLAQRGVEPFDPAVAMASLPLAEAPQAIVILSAGLDRQAPEYGGAAAADRNTLQRLRYGAWLHRQTRLPILVSGGVTRKNDPALANVMAATLETDFLVKTRWRERLSLNTFENAQGSAEILIGDGIERILLVTHAWHMPRARRAFERAGLAVIPAPMAFENSGGFQWSALVPSARALHTNYYAVHELIGRVWYALTA
jgi:uncharacterized SAM-binding protein YcdF (DUF218 family)